MSNFKTFFLYFLVFSCFEDFSDIIIIPMAKHSLVVAYYFLL